MVCNKKKRKPVFIKRKCYHIIDIHIYIQRKKYHPPLHLGVIAIEKGVFGSPSTTVGVLIYIYIYIYIYISSLSCHASSTDFLRHSSLSSIDSRWFSRLYPVSAQSCCKVLAGRPSLAGPCEGFQMNTSLMSSSLQLQQCQACFVRLDYKNCKCNNHRKL